MASSSNIKKHYDGSSDVEAFITRVELKAQIKGYDGEKCAQYMASQLAEGHALNVYLKLSGDDKKNIDSIKDALQKEFDASHRNRDIAVEKLTKCKPQKGESPSSFAYKLLELGKLAYSGLPDASQVIVKDYFVAAQSCEMQVALKSLTDFATKSVTDLATEVIRFQTAGVPSVGVREESGVFHVKHDDSDESMVDRIAEKVFQKLSQVNVDSSDDTTHNIDYVGPSRGRGRRNSRGFFKGPNRGRGASARGNFKCRRCQGPDHGYAKCPTRYCQACGQEGHDAWNRECPNYR